MAKKPILKSKRKVARVVLTAILGISMAAGAIFGFAGCSKDCQAPQNATSIESTIPDSSENSEVETPVESISFEEFMENHSDKALAFANDFVKADLLDNKTPLSQTWGFHANEEDELDSVSLTYTYSSSATERIVEVANATFTDPIDLDYIVEGEVTKDDVNAQITRETAITFDAKENYMNSDLVGSLTNFVTGSGKVTYFTEEASDKENVRKFKVAEETSSAINVYSLNVVGESDKEILANLNVSYNYELSHYATYPLGDKESVTISTEKYAVEEFAPENVTEAINDYKQEILTALDTHLLETAGKKGYGRTFDASKLVDVTWDIGSGETISEIKMISYYSKSETSKAYNVSTIKLETPINVNTLTKNNIDSIIAQVKCTAETNYTFQYDPTIQGTRDELVNSIFEAYGMDKECPEGAVRYFVDQGTTLDSTLEAEANGFVLVEISENGIKEFAVRIKTSSNDEGFITKLSNKENYRFYDEKSCTMEGNKISAEKDEIEQTADNQSDYDISYEEEMFM